MKISFPISVLVAVSVLLLSGAGVRLDPGTTPSATHPGNAAAISHWQRWIMNTPLFSARKELYKVHPRPDAAAVVSRDFVGPKLEMMEVQSVEARDDVHTERSARWSTDNGKTWSAFAAQPDTIRKLKGIEVIEAGGAVLYDAKASVLVQTWLRQLQLGNIWKGGLCCTFTYYRLSRDLGRTWSEPTALRYEPGPEFDPEDPLKPAFLRPNQGYPGNNILPHSNGTLVHCVCQANSPSDPENDQRTWKTGSLCFIGRWDAPRNDYTWTPGQRVSVSLDKSARGLAEPEVAELKDGRVLVVWRGSDTPTTPGHKWFSVSGDGGQTLSPVHQWKYDDGSSFYSPSSYHRMIRHSVTGKLYWVGNICPMPPEGNHPRYPLIIAEVDESIPALKRNTVSLIDDRPPNADLNYQLSNFSLYENRQTHELELFLTTYSQMVGQENWATADCYHYFLALAH